MIAARQLDNLREKCEAWLSTEGYRPKRTESGDIEFKAEGKLLYLEFDERDPSYLRLLLPHWWSIDSKQELRRAYVAASQVSHMCKGVKATLHEEESVWFSVEFVVASVETMQLEILSRHIDMISCGISEFRIRMNTQPQIDADESHDAVIH